MLDKYFGFYNTKIHEGLVIKLGTHWVKMRKKLLVNRNILLLNQLLK